MAAHTQRKKSGCPHFAHVTCLINCCTSAEHALSFTFDRKFDKSEDFSRQSLARCSLRSDTVIKRQFRRALKVSKRIYLVTDSCSAE